MTRTVIATDSAPAAVGPYSQAIRVGNLMFTAGQLPLNPATGTIEAQSIEDQTERVLENLSAVLDAGESGLDRVIKVVVFMTDLGKFAAMNETYARFFKQDPPARSAVQVAALPLGAQIEIEAVAEIRE